MASPDPVNPYAPPAAPVDTGDAGPPRRPFLVWVISAIYVVGGVWTLYIIYLTASGKFPAPPHVREYYDRLGTIDYLMTGILTALNFAAGVQLFRLKASALRLLLIALGVSVLSLLYQWVTGALPALFRSSGISVFFSLGMALAILAYVYRLKKRTVLR
jgi:hypothetical protein